MNHLAKDSWGVPRRGRPSDYHIEYAEQAAKLCRLGATDEEIADFFKDVRTINRWKIDHPDFCQALKDGKLVSDMDVADRLHQRALGFEYEEAQAHKLKTVEYKDGKRVKETDGETGCPARHHGLYLLAQEPPQSRMARTARSSAEGPIYLALLSALIDVFDDRVRSTTDRR
ncbi:hypothetical protein RAD15_25460 [Bradyrhizobium sp. 14AA]